MIPILAFDRYLDLQITTATFASDCSSELTCFKSPFASMRSSTAVNWIACLMSLSRSGNEDVASAASQYFSIDLISCGFALRNAARVRSTAASLRRQFSGTPGGHRDDQRQSDHAGKISHASYCPLAAAPNIGKK
jgi:hypothetical protein